MQVPARRSCANTRAAHLPSSSITTPTRTSVVSYAAAPAEAVASPQTLALPDTFKGFTLVRDEFVQEYGSRVAVYRHDRTGAQCMSVSNSDENKTFGAVFRTPVEDSTGIPHILEHSVLNGSQKYPVKEPFVELIKGSLHTFINAFTYPDRTCYPVASTNLQVHLSRQPTRHRWQPSTYITHHLSPSPCDAVVCCGRHRRVVRFERRHSLARLVAARWPASRVLPASCIARSPCQTLSSTCHTLPISCTRTLYALPLLPSLPAWSRHRAHLQQLATSVATNPTLRLRIPGPGWAGCALHQSSVERITIQRQRDS